MSSAVLITLGGGSAVVAATGAAAVVGAGAAIYGSNKASAAAKRAAGVQAESQRKAIDEQRSQFDAIQALLKPYVEAGNPNLTQPYVQAGPGALQGMQSLAGLRGGAEQRAAIQGIEKGAQFQELARQGEQGILQNASATGGLRGGNVQAALGQFRPQLLNQLIEAQYGKLAGLTSLGSASAQNLLGVGQASAAGTAAAGQASAQNIGNLLVGQGAAQAAGIVGQANAQAQGAAGIANAAQSGFQNYQLMQALNKPSITSGLGTGGFYGTQAAAQSAYGGAPVEYFAPTAPGGAGGWYSPA